MEFLGALNKIREEQRSRLINKGLSGQYNPVIAKLILSANHGMAEKTETDVTSKGKQIEGISLSFVTSNDSTTGTTTETTTPLPAETV